MKFLIILSLFIANASYAANAQKGKVAEVKAVEAATSLPEKAVEIEKSSDEDLAQAAQWLESADQKDQAQAAAATKEAEIKANENKKESEIPVLAATKEKVVEKKEASISKVLVSLGLVLSLLFAFSVFLKKFVKKGKAKKHSQIKVLTQHYLGPKKSLAIVRVAGESMLISITDHNINLIKTLALLDEEIPQDTPKNFSNSLENSMNTQDDEAEEFSISKIKDFVSGRLKNMKEI